MDILFSSIKSDINPIFYQAPKMLHLSFYYFCLVNNCYIFAPNVYLSSDKEISLGLGNDCLSMLCVACSLPIIKQHVCIQGPKLPF